jgi:hypothetical protein
MIDKNENIRVSVCMTLALAGSSNVVKYLEEEEGEERDDLSLFCLRHIIVGVC